MNRTLVWFRRDLRLADHAPLQRAAARGLVIPIFIFDRALLHHPETSVARVAFMLNCLRSLDDELRSRGGRLIFRTGNPATILPAVIEQAQAEGVYAYTDCERIYGRVRDACVNRALAERGMKIRWFEPAASVGELIPYPQYRQRWFADMAEPILPTPGRIEVPPDLSSQSLPTLEDLGLVADEKPIPSGGTQAARKLLKQFRDRKASRYYWQLSYPSAAVTTGLSPYIKFGVISLRECYQTAQQWQADPDQRVQRSSHQLISRLRWGSGFTQRFRYLPQLELRSLYRIFDEDGWFFDETLYRAWQQGETGFPIVDAAARCLLATGGWQQLNFRVRAIYASFLSNLLGIDWRYGALHFMRHLIDGDCPIDHYQWAMQAGVTHCADKTWTRIYNPQQVAVNRCDPEGTFIKHWLPELSHLPADQLGTPPPTARYPAPILGYQAARQARVRQLERQRQTFLGQPISCDRLALLPNSFIPFGADRFQSEIQWAATPHQELFPPPLDFDRLDGEQAQILRTWFVAQVNIPRPPKRSKSRQNDPTVNQLTLDL